MVECPRIGLKCAEVGGCHPTGERTAHFLWVLVQFRRGAGKTWSQSRQFAVHCTGPGRQNSGLPEYVMRKTNLWCFLLLLALAVVPGAANVFVASATFDVNVNDIYVPFMACGNLNFTNCGAADADPGGHGETAGTYTSLLSTNAQSGYISVFALDASTGDVIVGFNNGVSAVGNPWPFSTPEATIASDIAGGTTADNAALATFFADNLPFWVAPSLNRSEERR